MECRRKLDNTFKVSQQNCKYVSMVCWPKISLNQSHPIAFFFSVHPTRPSSHMHAHTPHPPTSACWWFIGLCSSARCTSWVSAPERSFVPGGYERGGSHTHTHHISLKLLIFLYYCTRSGFSWPHNIKQRKFWVPQKYADVLSATWQFRPNKTLINIIWICRGKRWMDNLRWYKAL